jgi:hypothetical protein
MWTTLPFCCTIGTSSFRAAVSSSGDARTPGADGDWGTAVPNGDGTDMGDTEWLDRVGLVKGTVGIRAASRDDVVATL